MSAKLISKTVHHHWEISVFSPDKIEIAQKVIEPCADELEWQSLNFNLAQLPALARELNRIARDYAANEGGDVAKTETQKP